MLDLILLPTLLSQSSIINSGMPSSEHGSVSESRELLDELIKHLENPDYPNPFETPPPSPDFWDYADPAYRVWSNQLLRDSILGYLSDRELVPVLRVSERAFQAAVMLLYRKRSHTFMKAMQDKVKAPVSFASKYPCWTWTRD